MGSISHAILGTVRRKAASSLVMVDPTQILEKRRNTLLPYKMKTTDRLSPLLLPYPPLSLITTRSFLLLPGSSSPTAAFLHPASRYTDR